MHSITQAINELYKAKLADNERGMIECELTQFARQLQIGFQEKVLNLEGNQVGHTVLSRIPKVLRLISGIKSLKLYGNLVRDTGLHKINQILVSNPQINSIDLGCNDLSDTSVREFEDILRNFDIISLNLGFREQSYQPNRFSRDGLTTLIELIIRRNQLQRFGMAGLDGRQQRVSMRSRNFSSCLARLIEHCTVLSTLNISNIGLVDTDQDPLSMAFTQNHNLRYLDLSKNSFPSGHMIVDGIVSINSLRFLDLSNCQINSSGGHVIAQALGRRWGVIVLDLSHNPIGSESIGEILTELATNDTLISLNIADTQFDSSLTSILGRVFLNNNVLSYLNLSKNFIGDQISDFFTPEMTLETLYLSTCRITDVGGLKIASSLATNETIKRLYLRDNFLTREAGFRFLDLIKTNEFITTLDLSSNQIDLFALEAIKEFCTRNKSSQRSRAIAELRKKYIALSIQSAKIPAVESTMIELRTELDRFTADVETLDKKLEGIRSATEANQTSMLKTQQEFEHLISSEENHIKELQDTMESLKQSEQRNLQEMRAKIEFEKKEFERIEIEAVKNEAEIPKYQTAAQQEIDALEAELVELEELLQEVTRISRNKKRIRDYEIPPYPVIPNESPAIPIEEQRELDALAAMSHLNEEEEAKEKTKKLKKKKGKKKAPTK